MFYKLWETLYCSIFSYITCIYDNILNIHTKGFLVIVNVAPVFGGKLALLGKAGKITAVSTFRFAAVVPDSAGGLTVSLRGKPGELVSLLVATASTADGTFTCAVKPATIGPAGTASVHLG